MCLTKGDGRCFGDCWSDVGNRLHRGIPSFGTKPSPLKPKSEEWCTGESSGKCVTASGVVGNTLGGGLWTG